MEIESSLRRDTTHYFIFPEYLDKTLTRKEGRRLSLDFAIESPTVTEIRLAAEKLEFDYEVQKYAAYPRQWWERKGLILIEKKKPKLQTLKDLSKEIKVHIRPALEKQKKSFLYNVSSAIVFYSVFTHNISFLYLIIVFPCNQNTNRIISHVF